MGKNLLQRIVMPEIRDRDYRDLFFRTWTTECSAFGETLTELCELHFNTWMNLFAAKKWFHYGILEDLYLGLDIKGDFSVEIIGSNRNAAYNRIDEKVFLQEYSDNQSPIDIKIENPAAYDGLYFILRYKKGSPCKIQSAGWFTDTPPRKKNKLAIVTCTFKREAYINKTIDLFENYLTVYPELQERMHLFVSDNGQTLDLNRNSKFVDIFYNINAGGAGGFGRGLIEVCKSNGNYTRCLFMDDDVEIIPESFYRTLVLADYLNEQYCDATINGAMLDLYNKVMFFENLAIQDGLWCHPYHREMDVLNYDNILNSNDTPESIFHNDYPKVDAAWYYSCFPIEQSKSIDSLPLPFFIRGDDVEYGYRNSGKAFIQLNGICIWHAPFYYRVNKITDNYYLSRNMFIVNALYTPDFKKNFIKLYTDKFRYVIAVYDYVSARLIIKALEDILKGSRLFEENPVDIMNDLNALAKENYEPVDDSYELLAVRDKGFGESRTRRIRNKIIKGCYKLIPYSKNILKRNSMNAVPEWFPTVNAFLLKRHVRVYNLLKHSSKVRSFSYHDERMLTKQFHMLLQQIASDYDRLENDYKTNFARLTSYEFWKKYLKLSE